MATSGTVLGNIVVPGGSGVRVRIEWQLAGQNIGGNYSTINWQGYVDFFGCDAQLDNGHVNWSGVTALYNNGGRVYNYAANFSNHTIGMGSGSFNIGHDGAGNANLFLDGSVAVFQTGTSAGSGGWGLPTIPRYANITYFNQDIITDERIRFNWGADAGCDYVSWWSGAYDGGGHHDIYVGNTGGNFQIDLTNLKSETTYDITVAVRRADSGLWTNSGTQFPTTARQGNIFPFRVP